MDERFLEVAKAIRPYLPALVPDQAPEFDQRLVELLRQAGSTVDVTEAIGELLGRSPATLNWAASALKDKEQRPPDLQIRRERFIDGGFSPLPNPKGGDPVDAERYVCPVDGHWVWWRVAVGEPIPPCRDHPNVALVLA